MEKKNDRRKKQKVAEERKTKKNCQRIREKDDRHTWQKTAGTEKKKLSDLLPSQL